MNYGAIGFVIGHEITHGFDDQGRQFDKEGNLVDWWAEETKKRYLEKASCIIKQYGNYTAQEVGLKVRERQFFADTIARVLCALASRLTMLVGYVGNR